MVTIRYARKDEVKKLQDLNDEAFVENPKYDSDLFLNWAQSEKGETYFSNLLNNVNDCCLIAENEGKLVGYIAASAKNFDDRNSTYIEIQNLGVFLNINYKALDSN